MEATQAGAAAPPEIAAKAQAHAEAAGRAIPVYSVTEKVATPTALATQPNNDHVFGPLGFLAVPLLLAIVMVWLWHISRGVR